MKLTDFYAYTEQTFDSFCKQFIRNERTDALRELAYTPFSGGEMRCM